MRLYHSSANLGLLAISVFLSACGGGGSTTPPANPNVGVYLDAKVERLEYRTNTLNGKTNSNGEFEYNTGEDVTFSLYGQDIAVVPGYSTLTPMDNNDDALHQDYPINVMRFLQTLDTNGVPGDGITLPDTANGVINVNFNQSMVSFENDTNVLSFISDNTNVSTLSASAEEAVNHFQSTLDSVSEDYVLNLVGKTATSVLTANYCSNNPGAGYTFSFTETGITMEGSDTINSTQDPNTGVITCTAGATVIEVVTWAEAAADPSWWLSCGPSCMYSELNRTSVGTAATGTADNDGRDYISTVWHTPNSNKITSTKRITNDPNFTHTIDDPAFINVITFQ